MTALRALLLSLVAVVGSTVAGISAWASRNGDDTSSILAEDIAVLAVAIVLLGVAVMWVFVRQYNTEHEERSGSKP